MKKLIGILLLLANSVVGQTTYKQTFNGIYSNLDRKSFSNEYFADSVKMFIFIDNKIAANNLEVNNVAVDGLNGFLTHMKYVGFNIKTSSSEFDKGFIATIYGEKEIYTIWMVVNIENKINIILIKQ